MGERGIDRRAVLGAAAAGAAAMMAPVTQVRGQPPGGRHAVTAERAQGGLTLHITGPGAARADTRLVSDCITELLACADRNNCFEAGFSPACIATIARHDEQCSCVSRAFGIAPAKPGTKAIDPTKLKDQPLNPRHSVKAERAQGGLTLLISGPAVARADAKFLNDCVTELLACADRNNCFEVGFNSACLETIAKHNSQCQCVSKAFGFARGR